MCRYHTSHTGGWCTPPAACFPHIFATDPDMGTLWARLPDELLVLVLETLWDDWLDGRRDSGAVRGTCRGWRDVHDAACKELELRDGVTEGLVCSLCVRLPALTRLDMLWVQSLAAEGLHAVGGLAELTWLRLWGCPNVTDVGLQELTSLTKLIHLNVYYCATSKAGRDTLKAAIPGLTTIFPSN